MSNQEKAANPDHPVMDVIVRRWSPYAYSEKTVADTDLLSIFEAARWAASSYNEQPWRFIVARKNVELAEYERILSCLVEANQAWAKHAPVLALGITMNRFSRNENPNRVALHDLGIAVSQLTMEATSRGLYVHQMAGIDQDKARETFNVPEEAEAQTAIAIGYPAASDAGHVDGELMTRDQGGRSRKPLSEFVWTGDWGRSADFV